MRSSIKFFTLAILAVVSLFFVTATMAQTSTTGEVTGVVTDPNGSVVPNVTVTLSGPNLIRAQTGTTDSDGRFRFGAIPPGRYTVETAATTGFGAQRQENVDVSLSRSTTVNITLAAAGVGEQVTVTAGAEIDQTTNTTGTNISTEQFSNFPTGRTVQSLYTIAPTVTRSGLRDASGRDRDPSVAGSSGPENNYILDGVTTTDPAFGGSGANLPFEFVQEVEIKTGAYGAEYGKSTGGIFNVITKSGSNQFRGDVFGYFTTKGLVRDVKSTAIPFTGAAPNGFSELDAGFDIGGPIVKDKLWFFVAFNPQYRKNFFLTQTFLQEVENKVTTPFYAGKLTWGINDKHTFTFSTFADHTKQEGHQFGFSGFGADLASFRGTSETGGSNYAFRLNSAFSPNFIAEFSVGLHFQRANTIPEKDETLVTDRFSVLRNNAILSPFETGVCTRPTEVDENGDPIEPVGQVVPCSDPRAQLRLAYVDGTGGRIERNFVRGGFGLKSEQDRNRWEAAARLQNVFEKHTFKYGFEWTRNIYKIDTASTGGNFTFTSDVPALPYRIENRFAICERTTTTTITCPDATRANRVAGLIAAGAAPTGVTTAAVGNVSINTANPFLLLDVVRARSFSLNTMGQQTYTDTQSFYVQDDWRVHKDLQFNIGVRWDLQQAYSVNDFKYLSLSSPWHTLQPRLGFIWDFTGKGRGKVFANFARFIETPVPLDINVRATGEDIQNDWNLNVSRINGGTGAFSITNFGNLGNHFTPIDPGLRPQSVNEWTAGIEWGPASIPDLTFGVRGIYRAQDNVIEDGSFDDGTTYFIFNPGRRGSNGMPTTEDLACAGSIGDPADPDDDIAAQCFGRARRFYRAIEFTATKRFSNNWQLIGSYVYSSLIGNYEGLFRNDNGQSDPNITSLFDLVSLLNNMYGRLPNDRPHQFKLDGSYRWPFGLMTSASFRAQSGIPFNQLIPHFLYGDNEGFAVPRGTAVNPLTGSNRTPFTTNLDIGAYYPIQFGENKELRLTVDWFNVLNSQKAIREDETYQINSGAPGVAAPLNPFYGTGTIFQFPSHFRFGVKFSF
jgi:outer membrane receptor protein involved in Fe transport